MRYLFATVATIAASVCPAAFADAPPTALSVAHQQEANSLAQPYRQCLQDTLGERYINVSSDPLKMASEVETSCQPQLQPVLHFLSAKGYTQDVIERTMIEIKAKADGAAIAYVHRLPAYRF